MGPQVTAMYGAIAGALVALFGLVWAFIGGSRQARQKAKSEALQGYHDTREKADAADIVGDDPGLALRWLQSRNPDKR